MRSTRMAVNIETEIAQGAKLLNITITEAQIVKLASLVKLLGKWNKVYNLTAIRQQEQVVKKHILDSLSICPYVNGNYILDVGSGAGFPGIVIAILFPEKKITTIDANIKKTRFMTQAKIEIEIDNLSIEHNRVENYKPDNSFDIITSRAFASIEKTVALTKHLLSATGKYLIMKGIYPQDELEVFKQTDNILDIECRKLQVPYVEENRHVVILSHQLR